MSKLSIRRRLFIFTLMATLIVTMAVSGPAFASNREGESTPGGDVWGESGGGEDPSPWPWSDNHCREEFDDPLAEFHRIQGPDLRVVSAGSPTGEEGPWTPPELTIEIHGTPVAAWIYWIGETRAVDRLAGEADPGITLEKLAGGTPVDTRELFGEEVGRRHQLFTDEAAPKCKGNGGEVVMRAAVPLDLLSEGTNEFRLPAEGCLNCFNEPTVLCDGHYVPIYKRALGVTLVVLVEGTASTNPGEAISLGGADYATRGKNSRRPECDPAQTRTELTCFHFDPLAADSDATLTFGVADLLPRVDANQKLSTTEQTLFASSAGVVSEGDLTPLETNRLSDETYFYIGRNISLYDGRVQLLEGDTEACFRVDLPEKQEDEKQEQTAVLAHASLVLDRGDGGDAGAGDGSCKLDPGESSRCAVLQLEKSKVSVKGEAGGIVGDVCVAPKAKFEISGKQYVDGTLRLGEGASYKRKDKAWVGSVSYDEDLTGEIGDARALAEDAAGRSCTQSFGKVKKSLTIFGDPGLNVICIKELELKKNNTLTLDAEEGSTFVVNVTGKKFKLTDGARITLEGGVRPDEVLVNLIGKGEDVELGGGKGGESCCETVVEGTLLAPDRKIKLHPGMVYGSLLSAKEIALDKGAAVRARPLSCLER